MPTENVPISELIASPQAPVLELSAAPAVPAKAARRPSDFQQRGRATLKSLRLANDKVKAEIDAHKGRTAREELDHGILWSFRRWFGTAGFVIVVAWQTAVLRVVFLDGLGLIHLTDAVMVALLTTTTANVVGLLVIVMKFVFAPVQTSTKGNEAS